MKNNDFDDDFNDEQELVNALQEKSDIDKAIGELFKDGFKDSNKKEHDIDLRTRLLGIDIKNLSIIAFLQSIDVEEYTGKGDRPNLATGLNVLSMALKRHKVSLEGKSREEIVRLFQENNALKNVNTGTLKGLMGTRI